MEHPHTKILDYDDQSDNSKRTINPSHDGTDSIYCTCTFQLIKPKHPKHRAIDPWGEGSHP